MKTTSFKISGMHCASCAVRNEESLKKLTGVKSVVVNFATQQAAVEFDEAVIKEQALYDAVVSAGYQVLTKELMHNHQHEVYEELGTAWKKALWAILLSVPPLILAMFSVELPWEIAGYNSSILIQAIFSAFENVGYIGELRQRWYEIKKLFAGGAPEAIPAAMRAK